MSWEAVKRPDRLAPNLVHVCGFFWEWTLQFAPQYHRGHWGGGGYGVTNLSLGKLPNGWTDWHQIRYTYVDSSGNGHRLKHFAPRYPSAALGGGGGLGGQQFKSLGNVVKRLDRLGIHFAHIIQVNLGMDTG